MGDVFCDLLAISEGLRLSLKFEHSRADAGDDTAVDEQVGAVDEGGVLAKRNEAASAISSLVATRRAAEASIMA